MKLALLCLPAALVLVSASRAQEPQKELRGVFLSAADGVYGSRAEIAAAMEAFSDAHFNVVFPAVWDGAYTLWHSATLRETIGVDCDPAWGDRDVLGELVFEAHRFGLELVPWFEGGLVARGNLLEKKPTWAAIGKDQKPFAKDGERWLDALHPEVQQFFLALTLELARNYDLDGIAGSERFPALPIGAGYDARTLAAYKTASGADASRDDKDPFLRRSRARRLARPRAVGRAASP